MNVYRLLGLGFILVIGNLNIIQAQNTVQAGIARFTGGRTNGQGGTWGSPSSSLYWKFDFKNNKDLGESNEIIGSHFDSEDFLSGTVYYKNEVFPNVLIKYDAFNDELILEKGVDVLALYKSPEISARIENKKIDYIQFHDKTNELKAGYLFVLHSGFNHTLYLKKGKHLKEAKESANTLHKSFPARFVDYQDYYIKDKSGEVHYLKTKTKNILGCFDKSKHTSIKKFIKDKKVDLKEPEGVAAIFNYAESIEFDRSNQSGFGQ